MKTAIVLVHGFGGYLYEIETLADELRKSDFSVFTPIIAGHGLSSAETRSGLRDKSREDWLETVRESCKQAFSETEKVIYIGFSMGAMIGTVLNAEFDFSKFVTINAPVHFWNLKQVFKNVVKDLKNLRIDHIQYYLSSGGKLPLQAMWQFQLLLGESRKNWKNIEKPILIIQTLDDDAVQARSASCIFERVSSINKQIIWVPTGGHLVLKSEASQSVCTQIIDWIISK